MPRFDSYEDGDLEEIIQEICCSDPTGPYFVVGGRFIRPDEIVSFQGPEDSPTFTLKDGSTVTHNRFGQEENGDLLFRALRVIRRPIGKSQLVKPSFNRILLGKSDGGTVLDSSFSTVNDLSGFSDSIEDIDFDNGVAITQAQELININDGSVTNLDLSGGNTKPVDIDSARLNPQTNKVIAVVDDDNGDNHITSTDYDNSNTTTLSTPGPETFDSTDIAPSLGIGVQVNEFNTPFKYQLDGSGFTRLSGSNEKKVAINANDNEFYTLIPSDFNQPDIRHRKLSDGSLIREQDIQDGGIGARHIEYNEREDNIYVVDESAGKTFVIDRLGGDNTEEEFGTNLTGKSIKIALDKSAI